MFTSDVRPLHVLVLFLLVISVSVSAALYTLHPSQENLLHSKSLHIFMCGTGNPEPGMQALRKPACVAVIGNGHFLLFDAGEGSAQTLAGLGLPIDKMYNVFITHWHSDHFGGLGQVINQSWMYGRNRALNVYGPAGVNAVVSALRRAYRLDAKFRAKPQSLNTKYAFGKPRLVTIKGKQAKVFQNHSEKVYAFPVNHLPVYPAFGYRIQYKNCKVVISGDTRVVASLAQNARNADVLINNVASHPLYLEELKIAGHDKAAVKFTRATFVYHSDSLELAKMANQTKVRHLFVTHLTPAIGTLPAIKATFIEGMDKYYHRPITITADRDEITVTPEQNGECKVEYHPAKQPLTKPVRVQAVA